MNSTGSFIIGIGSNVVDRETFVTAAIEAIMSKFAGVSASEVYESDEYGKPDSGIKYCNAVVSGNSYISREELEAWLKEYEKEQGRTEISDVEHKIYIDLDLVVWNNKILRPTDFERPYFNVGYRYLLANGALENY